MERRPLGSAGFDVPAIGMGTWQTFDVLDDKEEAHVRDVVSAALDAGTDLFDSSPMYGESERVLAEALRGRRDEALVATKVWTPAGLTARSAEPGGSAAPSPSAPGPDDREADRQIERALRWYGGTVDLYQVHNLVAWESRLRTLQKLKDEGRVRAVGLTHYSHAAFPGLLKIMEDEEVDAIQVPYNVADRAVEEKVIPAAEAHDVGVVVMMPLGQGGLVGRAPPEAEMERFEPYGVTTWPQVLLKWILSDRRVSCVIPATSNPEHARQNAKAGEPPWFEERERERVSRLASDT